MTRFFEETPGEPAVRGFLYAPPNPRAAVVLAHGAGSDCNAPLLVAVAGALAAEGFAVLRCDLPFRQARPSGPPVPSAAEADRRGLKRAVAAMGIPRVFLGGHSYGGRQATLLAAEEPELIEGLLLLSYPLHPPARPAQLRTKHFPELRTPALFIHGTRDAFGSIKEMRDALKLIPARTGLAPIEGRGHDLRGAAAAVLEGFREFYP